MLLVSSAWHGVHAGYYLCNCSISLILVVEDLYRGMLRSRLTPAGRWYYDWVAWFAKMQWIAYVAMAHQLLHLDLVLAYWSSIYYLGHLVLPIFYLLGLVVVQPLVNILLPLDKTDRTD